MRAFWILPFALLLPTSCLSLGQKEDSSPGGGGGGTGGGVSDAGWPDGQSSGGVDAGGSAGASGGGSGGSTGGVFGGGGFGGTSGTGATGGASGSSGASGSGGTGGQCWTVASTAWLPPSAWTAPDFTNPENVVASDDQYAVRTYAGVSIKTFAVEKFGFQVPGNAEVLGLEASVEVAATATVAANFDHVDFIGPSTGTKYPPITQTFGTSDSVMTFGSPTDLWKIASLTPADVNADSFQFSMRVACAMTPCSTGVDVRIDQVLARVHYRTPCN